MDIIKLNRFIIKAGLLIISTVLTLSSHVYAATITVKQLGGGDYTTISAAISNAQLDDTIKVYPGRYEEAVVIDKNLTLIGSGPQLTTIYSPSDGITVNSSVASTIIGFTITSSGNGIYTKNNSDVIIKNNCLVSNGGRGITMAYPRVSIINNTIFSNADTGIYSLINGSYYATSISIINNIIYNNGKFGIDIDRYGTSPLNISYNNVGGNILGDYNADAAIGTGDISENPAFMNFSNGNFALQSTSTSINVGRPGSADSDPDGTRNDMGVYGGPDAIAFWPYPPGAPIITNLTATPTVVPQGGTISINATGEIR